MSDPRNVAHAKKVTQQKHHAADASTDAAATAQPGKKLAIAKKKHDPAGVAADADPTIADETPTSEPATPVAPEALQGSLVVLTKLKELEFHSRASLERLGELGLTVEGELKQPAMVGPMSDVYSAQSALQTKLTALIEIYKAECDRLQGASA